MKYMRQLNLFGNEGQKKLGEIKVAVVGAGGLGSPLITYLLRAGVIKTHVFDRDTVSESNLNRQFLYSESDIGKKKAYILKNRFNVDAYDTYIDQNNIHLLNDYSIIADCSDNAKTKLLLNDYAIRNNKYLSLGSINAYYGFQMNIEKGFPCLRCIGYKKIEAKKDAIGSVAGVIGSIQAMEIIKKILGIELKYGVMSYYDALENEFDYIRFNHDPKCSLHGEEL